MPTLKEMQVIASATTSVAHQMGKLSQKERVAMIKFLEEAEISDLATAKKVLTFFYRVPKALRPEVIKLLKEEIAAAAGKGTSAK